MITKDYTRTAMLEALHRLEESDPTHALMRRRRVRFDVDLTGWFKGPEDGIFKKMKPATVVDLSGTGVKLQVDEDLPQGAVVRLRIALPNTSKPISAMAQVAWHEQFSEANVAILGLRFTQMSAAERQDLEAFIEHLLSRS